MQDKMIGNKAITNRGRSSSGCDCKDFTVPKRTQRNREEERWTKEYLEEMEDNGQGKD
jgi:hypothetical protein